MKKPNSQVHEYIINHINPFIQPLVYQLVVKKPANPVTYAINWLTQYENNKKFRSRVFTKSDEEDQEVDKVTELDIKIQKTKRFSTPRRRICPAEEDFGNYNNRNQLQAKQSSCLTEREQELIRSYMRSSILFQHLDEKDQEIIIKAIKAEELEEYDVVLKEGESGNHFFIVSSGEFDCYKIVNGDNIFIKTYKEKDSFGELAMMYNAPRAATIVTRSPGRLLVLERLIFSQLLKVAALRKQTIIKEALEKVQLFKEIPKEQKYGLVQLLKEEKFKQAQYVIREGEAGDKFYIVIEGSLVAQKEIQGSGKTVVMNYEQGSYFGQLALINNDRRQASVKATSEVKLASMSREGFKRVFGSIVQTLKLNSSKYHE